MPLDPIVVGILLVLVAAALAYFVFASFLFGAGYQPTPRAAALEMLRLAEVSPRDTLYDLGAGTGALVFRAARIYRAKVVGVEVEPIRVLILRLRRRFGSAGDRVSIVWGDLFELNFADATVVATFLWPGAMRRLRPKFEAELPAGARVVSHCHPIEGWTPELHDARTDVYLYRWPPTRGTTAAPTGGT